MIRAHKNSFLALIRGAPILAAKTFDALAKNPDGSKVAPLYVVVHSDAGIRSSERLLAAQTRADFTYTVHSVGETAEQAQLGAERVYAQVLGKVPVVAGRKCWPITAETSQPVRLDTDVSPPLFYAVDVFRLSSIPG